MHGYDNPQVGFRSMTKIHMASGLMVYVKASAEKYGENFFRGYSWKLRHA